MRRMQSISSASASADSLSLPLWEINHSSLVAKREVLSSPQTLQPIQVRLCYTVCFCFHQPFSHLSPPVRFTARQGQVWPVNLWWLKCLPVLSWKEHVERQKFMERLNIVLFISREMEKKRERRFRMCDRFVWQIKGGICWAGDMFSHTFPVRPRSD